MAKERLKILKPTMREKKHYLVVNAGYGEIEKVILKYLGIFGFAKASPVFVLSKNGKTIFAVNRKYVNDVKGALAFSSLKCEYVSGLVRKAKEKIGGKR